MTRSTFAVRVSCSKDLTKVLLVESRSISSVYGETEPSLIAYLKNRPVLLGCVAKKLVELGFTSPQVIGGPRFWYTPPPIPAAREKKLAEGIYYLVPKVIGDVPLSGLTAKPPISAPAYGAC